MRSESARPGKRPLRALSATEKMEAIQRVHEGESKASVARDIGVPESTLRGWCKSEHKIRGMARNSSTPDSEAHSPASATNLLTTSLNANHSSEEEGPMTKRMKLDTPPTATSSFNENSENDVSRLTDPSKMDYVSLMTSMAGMRPENSALLLQQLGLLSSNPSPLAKSLLNLPSVLSPHSSAVGLVENGLQYTKGTSSSKRHSTSAAAVAPAQIDKISRKSLPPAAEAPQTHPPVSPRKTNEMMQNNNNNHNNNNKRKETTAQLMSGQSANKKQADEALWLWLTQQQQLLGQQSAAFNLTNNQMQDGSWFWQWYKQYNYPPFPATSTATTTTPTTPVAKKSPSKARALLDNVLCNNNNENVKYSINNGSNDNDVDDDDDGSTISTQEAIAHGEKFVQWLEKCSEPSVTWVQIIQFKYLLDNLKTKKRSNRLKQSRK